MLPILLHPAGPGAYTFHVPSMLRVWKQPDRTHQILNGNDVDMRGPVIQDVTLYVEGLGLGVWTITVDWSDGPKRVPNADSLTVNVFTWSGPLNAPQYSELTYQADSGATAPGDSGWLDPVRGTINYRLPPLGTVQCVNIYWGGGPAIGRAVFKASPDYIWGLGVNLVSVAVGAPDGPPFGTFAPYRGLPVDGGNPTEEGIKWKRVNSTPNQEERGLSWAAKVTLAGPGDNKGVRFMHVGFIQNLDVVSEIATYQSAGKQRTSDLVGKSFLDNLTTDDPYYCREPSDPQIAQESRFFDPDPKANPPRLEKVIRESDRPGAVVPLTYARGATVSDGDSVVSSIDWFCRYRLYVAAQTTETAMAANCVYTAEARATWAFGASGAVAQSAPYEYSAHAGAGIAPPEAGWEAVFGDDEMIYRGKRAFEARLDDRWTASNDL